jgi:hypothetical protein
VGGVFFCFGANPKTRNTLSVEYVSAANDYGSVY